MVGALVVGKGITSTEIAYPSRKGRSYEKNHTVLYHVATLFPFVRGLGQIPHGMQVISSSDLC